VADSSILKFYVASNLAQYLVFVCIYREKPDSHKYCDDTAHHQWAKRGKRKARSNDIAAATRPKGSKDISAVFAYNWKV